MYISLMPQDVQEQIKEDLIKASRKLSSHHLDLNLEAAMSSKLEDLEDLIDTEKYNKILKYKKKLESSYLAIMSYKLIKDIYKEDSHEKIRFIPSNKSFKDKQEHDNVMRYFIDNEMLQKENDDIYICTASFYKLVRDLAKLEGEDHE